MEDLIQQKITEAGEILKSFGLPTENQNKVACLTLLALCGLKPQDKWENAKRRGMTLSKDIMEFVNSHYLTDYKANTRESFRSHAINPFVEKNIADLNPDDPTLKPTSSKTHYSITILACNTIQKYGTQEWKVAAENFVKFTTTLSETAATNFLLKSFSITGYKSIMQERIELGRFNVFIGANGSGKSNILEALAAAGASKANDMTVDGLYSRGVRIGRPDMVISSFLKSSQKTSIDISLSFFENSLKQDYLFSLSPASQTDIYTKWVDLAEEALYPDVLLDYFHEITSGNPGMSADDLLTRANNMIAERGLKQHRVFDSLLTDYAIFDLNTKSLRGIQSDSRKTPLGINGEGLDVLIANLTKDDKSFLIEKGKLFFDWLGEIITDKEEKFKLSGHKLGKGTSNLYMSDKFMHKGNNIFSAENSNEGVLHVLFYLALMISNKTPKLFAIDNIETALNPMLCKALIETLADLSKTRGKQVLVTTHNPAILDGLNLLDDEQRLFDVYRDDEGHTRARRITFKPGLSDKGYKLSEMWMSGLLGAIPRNF